MYPTLQPYKAALYIPRLQDICLSAHAILGYGQVGATLSTHARARVCVCVCLCVFVCVRPSLKHMDGSFWTSARTLCGCRGNSFRSHTHTQMRTRTHTHTHTYACARTYTCHTQQWRRLFLSPFFHGDDFHLYYNMASLIWKGRQMEPPLGPSHTYTQAQAHTACDAHSTHAHSGSILSGAPLTHPATRRVRALNPLKHNPPNSGGGCF